MATHRMIIDIELHDTNTPDDQANVSFVEDLQNDIANSLNDPLGRIISWRIHGTWDESDQLLYPSSPPN